MNLKENILRIKEVMGLLNEQKVQIQLPTVVSGNYIASNCDELHAFQGTKGKVIGNMNVKVKEKLDECKKNNLSVWVSEVRVVVKDMTVSWSVIISESNDGQFWGGFTSRGAGCNNRIETRWNDESEGNGPNSITNKVKTAICADVNSVELINKVEFKNLGDNSFIQGFYRYKCGNGNNNIVKVSGKDINELRNNLKQQTQNISIDLSSVKVDMNNYTVIFNEGNEQIKVLSLIFSDNGELEKVFQKVKTSNPTIEEIKRGKINNIDWLISVIR